MEQVCGEVHLKEEGVKTLERVGRTLSTNTPSNCEQAKSMANDTQSSHKNLAPKVKEKSLNTKAENKPVSCLL
jgi:hypothetical protein